MMPKKLITYGGYRAMNDYSLIPVNSVYQRTTSPEAGAEATADETFLYCNGFTKNDLKDLLDTIVEIDSIKVK